MEQSWANRGRWLNVPWRPDRKGRGLVASVLVSAATLAGPATAAADTPDNAALLYLRYATLQQSAMPELTRDYTEIDWANDAGMAAELAKHASIVEGFLRATDIERCDFGVETDVLYIYSLAPHLKQMRSAAKLLAADARRLAPTDPVAAAERLAAMVRLGDHTADGDFLISSLVGMAIHGLLPGEVEYLQAVGALTPEAKAVIVASLDGLDGRDLWNVREAIKGEQAVTMGMLRAFLDGDPLTRASVESDDSLRAAFGSVLSRDQAVSEFKGLEAAYKVVLAAWGERDKPGWEDRFRDPLVRGEYGSVAKAVLPSITHIARAESRARESLDRARALLSEAEEAR